MRILLILLLIVASTSCKTVKNQTISDAQIVAELMLKQENCWNKGDLTCFMEFYLKSDSLTFIGKSGISYGWNKTLENYKNSYKNKSEMGRLSFENISILQLNSEYIYVIGKWNLKRQGPLNSLSGHYTLIWHKINGEWLIISDHSS